MRAKGKERARPEDDSEQAAARRARLQQERVTETEEQSAAWQQQLEQQREERQQRELASRPPRPVVLCEWVNDCSVCEAERQRPSPLPSPCLARGPCLARDLKDAAFISLQEIPGRPGFGKLVKVRC